MIDETLNILQKQAIEYSAGSLIVLAGPGAGKTKVLTHRIAHILNNSESQRFKILALTFTNKAADEMKQRVEKLVKDTKAISRTFIGTFHGFAYQTLKSYGSYIGISSDFIIYEKKEDLQKILFDAIVQYLKKQQADNLSNSILFEKYNNTTLLEKDITNIFFKIEKIKNQLYTKEEFETSYLYSKEIELILDIYNSELKKYNILDFSDLIIKTILLFNELPFLKKDYQKIFKYILVDEGQDTNKIQFELLKLLCGDTCETLFVVADEDQVIYEWNDARFEYLLKLQTMFHAELIQLNETYRCPDKIIEAANNLISNNKARLQGKHQLITHKQNTSEVIEINSFETNDEEIEFLKNKISEIGDYNSCAIISRNRKILDDIKNVFDKKNIPSYSPSFQDKFVSREINMIVYVLKSIINENDKVAIFNLCQYFNLDYSKILDNNDITLLQQFIHIIDKEQSILILIEKVRNDKENFFRYIETYINNLISINKEPESNISEDNEALQKYYKKFKSSDETISLSNFLNFIALSSNNRVTEKGVALLTGHAAKGLEFDNIFIVSLNEGIFPDFRAVKANGSELEEERRNCYVAITRTKKKLFLSYTKYKETNFVKRSHEPSRFIKEMKINYIF